MVARTRFSATFHVHCPFCYNLTFGVLWKGRNYKTFWNVRGKEFGDFIILEYVFNIIFIFYLFIYFYFWRFADRASQYMYLSN